MVKKIIRNSFLISLIFLLLISLPAYADNWDNMLIGEKNN